MTLTVLESCMPQLFRADRLERSRRGTAGSTHLALRLVAYGDASGVGLSACRVRGGSKVGSKGRVMSRDSGGVWDDGESRGLVGTYVGTCVRSADGIGVVGKCK